MKNKIKYFLIIFFASIIVAIVAWFFLFRGTPSKCVDVYRWDLQVFKSNPAENKDELIQKIMKETVSIPMLSPATKEDYIFWMEDPIYKMISDSTYSIFNKDFPYIDEINNGFCIYKQLFPKNKEVKIIVYLKEDVFNAWDPAYQLDFQPVNYLPTSKSGLAECDWISVGLHWFLGADHTFYATENIPKYIKSKLDSMYISPMIFHQLGKHVIFEGGDIDLPTSFLDFIIREAKPYFFAQHILSNASEDRILGNSIEDIIYFKQYEKAFWKEEVLANDLLYSKDQNLWKEKYIKAGDYLVTTDGTEMPSRFGVWTGLQILNAYLQNNDVSLKEVLFEKDYKKIINQSNYQP